MPSLAESQGAFRRAIGTDLGGIDGLGVIAPVDPVERLAIYRRHFRESFRRHLRGRFPTVEWLIGTPHMIELADALVRSSPPRAPSLAEYGGELASALSGDLGRALPPYVASVAWLDWHLGNVAIATANVPLAIASLATVAPDALGDLTLTLQPGLVYLESEWPVDTLLDLRLSNTAPDTLAFTPLPVQLELRGSRGTFRFTRLDAGSFAFREALQKGATLTTAAEAGLAAAPDFDISTALAALFAEGLVAAIQSPDLEVHHA